MAVTANSIITPQTPRSGAVALTTANTTYSDTPTNTAALAAAGANGGRITKISAIPRATVTATQVQLFRSLDSGVTKRLFDTALMAAYTMAQTTEAPTTDFGYSDTNPIILAAGEIIYAAIGVSGNVAVQAEWADY